MCTRSFSYCNLRLISNKLKIRARILKSILRSHEKCSNISDLKRDDLIRKGPFPKAEKSIAVGSRLYLPLLF